MKREKIIYLGLILLIAYLTIIERSVIFSSENTTKTFNLSELELTRIDVPCEIYLTKGDNEKLVIEAPNNILNRIVSNENNGILTIAAPIQKKVFGIFNLNEQVTGKIRIFINHNQLERIIVNENAKIISVDYKPISLQASSELKGNQNHIFSVKMPSIKLSRIGLIDLLPIILSKAKNLSI